MDITTKDTPTSRREGHVGLDVHKDTISVAVAWHVAVTGELRVDDVGVVSNRADQVARLASGLSRRYGDRLSFAYEAGPCGFALHRQLVTMGHGCTVAAPTLIPKRSGNRVKTDRRDARELARLSLTGLLTPIWIPDPEQESLRDLVRCRMVLKDQIGRARRRIRHFTLRRNLQPPQGGSTWTRTYRSWLKDLKLETPAAQKALRCHLDVLEDLERRFEDLERDLAREVDASELKTLVDELCALRGVGKVVAVSLLAEVGDLRRFPSAGAFMSYLGLTPSEHSSGGRRKTGGITKTGNSLLRRLMVESAWTYRFSPRETLHLQRKANLASRFARERAWAAQKDLCHRYRRMVERGKSTKTVAVAVARSLAGYVWDIGNHAMNQLEATNQTVA